MSLRNRPISAVLAFFALLVLIISEAKADEYPVVAESCVAKVDVLVLDSENGWVIHRICSEQITAPEEIQETVKFSI